MSDYSDNDSDDSAPEEITQEVAKEEALHMLDNEKKAIESTRIAIKNKRKLICDKFTQQKTNKRLADKSVDKLPLTVLEELAPEVDAIAGQPSRQHVIQPTKRAKKKRVKCLDTSSTKFDVVNAKKDLSEILSQKLKDKKSALNFKDQMLFGKRRVKRITCSKLKSYFDKQYVNKI